MEGPLEISFSAEGCPSINMLNELKRNDSKSNNQIGYQSHDHSAIQSINQPISQSINQSTNEILDGFFKHKNYGSINDKIQQLCFFKQLMMLCATQNGNI